MATLHVLPEIVEVPVTLPVALAVAVLATTATASSGVERCHDCNLRGASASDRGSDHATVDLYYELHTANPDGGM